MSALIFVRDGRTLPYLPVTIAALRALVETCDLPRADKTRRSYPHALAVYMALLRLANEDRTNRVAIGQKEIKQYAGCGRTTIQAVLPDLVAAGVLKIHERQHANARIENEYVVVEPPAGSAVNDTPARQTSGGGSPDEQHAGARPSPPSEARADVGTAVEEQQEARDARPDGGQASSSTVSDLFNYWRDTCNHPASRPTRDRLAKIQARLREGYTPAQIRTAIDGARRHPFVNDAGKVFDEIDLICRNGAKVEDFIERARRPLAASNGNVHEIRPRTVSEQRWLEKRQQEQEGIEALKRVMAAEKAAPHPDDIEGEATEL